MKAILFVLLTAFLCSCNVSNSIRGNRDIQSKEFSIDDYSSVRLTGLAKMIYQQKPGSAPYLTIEIDENLLPYLDPVVEGGELKLKTTENINPTKYIIYTNSSSLTGASLSGSGNLTLENAIETDNLDLTVRGSGKITAGIIKCMGLSSSVSGSGSVQIDSLEAESFNSSVSGSGKVTVKGAVEDSDIDISGSGRIEAQGMTSQKVKSRVRGSGSIRVHAVESIDANISGSGRIYYKGDPQNKNVSKSGSGKIIQE